MANAVTTIAENNSLAYEVFWKPLLNDPKINALPFALHSGKIGKELYFDSEFTDTPTIKATCGWDYKDGTGITKKALDPVELDFSFEQCYTVFLKSIFGDSLPDGWRKGELTPEIINRIITKQSNAFNTNMLYALFLSDTGSSFPWLAGIDGVYAKLLAGVAAVDGTVDAGAIADSDLTPANIEGTMYGIYTAQSALMKTFDNNQKAFIVTQTVYEAWSRFLQIGNGSAWNYLNPDTIKNGVSGITYQGIPLINANYVDRGLALYGLSGSPAAVTDPNRVILTVPSNHHIMIDGTGFEMIEPFYERKDDLVLSPASAMIDYQYGYGELNVIAGF
ncbi:hypothetical protein UFOVP1605_21 [uncultured Caudovirales phage]|uniref:Uncharacterized protein n=1 Tax=uncultured Caudovirales phage TaxID=2100421 RepID=A0A6J5SS68_9CAUD|nr:hypothetical protein UFOVP1605_21 [uncultured Caudovirales phage]